MFNTTCIYGFIFESIIPKDNPALVGRDRSSHPIIISCDDFKVDDPDAIVLTLVFIGNTVSYVPYFYYALIKGGETGILKERTPYEVCDITEFTGTDMEESIKIDDQQINNLLKPEIWEYNIKTEAQPESERNFQINLLSPLRYKVRGAFTNKVTAKGFAECLHRRAQVLCSQYGNNDFSGKYTYSGNWTVTDHDTVWKDYLHYSGRQKKEMLLGGLTGSFVLSGKFTPYEVSLLRFAELFHGGKNTVFGLGKMKVNENGEL